MTCRHRRCHLPFSSQNDAPSAPRPSAPRGAPYASPQFAELVAPFAPTTSGSAIASFLFALLGLTLLPLLGQLISIILGHRALRKIKRSEGAIEGRWLARTGLILSYSALGLALCGFVALVLGFVALAAALTGQ